MGGNCSIEVCGQVFAPTSRQASSNYGIGSDGRVGMYVEEKNRAWTSGSGWNDNRAVTIECSNLADGSLTQALCVSSLDRCDAIRTCYGLHADDAFARPDSLDGQRLGAAERLLVSVIHELSLRPAD